MTRHLIPLAAALVAALVAALGGAATLHAQGTVRGVLFDSLRTSRPVGDADVVLLGVSRRTRTDRSGRFEFADVPAGTHTVAFWAPWLDSVAVPTLRREVLVGRSGAVTADLATPSRSTFQLALCGTELEAGQSILIGEVRGPGFVPRPGVGVNARWTETILGTGVFERRMVASADTSDAAGMYALCGLPSGSEVALRAVGDGGTRSGEIILPVRDVAQRRDLVVSPPGTTGRVTGRVLGPGGTPIAAAVVAVGGDSSASVRAREDGGFTLEGIPRRSLQLVARAVGFVPALTDIQLTDAELGIDDIELARVPPELEAVIVEGRRVTARQLEFETRRRRGLGMFISDEQLARMPMPTVTAVASLLPRTRAVGAGSKTMLMLQRQSFGGGQITTTCNPRFYVDGYDNGYLDAEEQEWLIRRAKRMEVYPAQTAPPRYNDFDGCGVVLIWTA
jgi:hypothetical protein